MRHPGAPDWADIPQLPLAAVALLRSRFAYLTSTLEAAQTSADGETVKLLVRLQDGLQVEAVIMVYRTTSRAPGVQRRPEMLPRRGLDRWLCAFMQQRLLRAQLCQRLSAGAGVGGEALPGAGRRRATLCVSSQVGCQMGCTFCATGSMGLLADLSAGEIVEQMVHASAYERISNVVYMASTARLLGSSAQHRAPVAALVGVALGAALLLCVWIAVRECPAGRAAWQPDDCRRGHGAPPGGR